MDPMGMVYYGLFYVMVYDGLNDGLLSLLLGSMWLNNIFKLVLCD